MRLTTCHDQQTADARRTFIAELVLRLRAARKDTFIERVMEQGGALLDDRLKDLSKLVDGICSGAERAAAASTVKLGMTFRELGEAWTSGKLHEQ